MAPGTAKKSVLNGRPFSAAGALRSSSLAGDPSKRAPMAASAAIQIRQMAESLGRLADEGRLRILFLLEEETRNVAALSTALGQDRHSLSHHLRILRVSGLILATRSGRRVDYSLTAQGRLGVKAARLVVS